MSRFDRRELLRRTTFLAAAPCFVPAAALGSAEKPGANDRIRVGLVGGGFRSRELTRESPPDLELAAVADCDLRQITGYLAETQQHKDSVVRPTCAQYQDYRRMLDKEKLDGVLVATTTHARPLISIHGMQAGLGAIFVGDKGKLEINRNKLAANPKKLIQGAPPPADKSEYAGVAHEHLRNWVHCMRTREKPVAHAEVGHRSSVICHLVNICRELGRRLRWDPIREEFPGDDEANKFRARPQRRGYELPEIG